MDMKMIRIYYHSISDQLPISELDIHPDLLDILVESGIIEVKDNHIGYQDCRRLYKMLRLKDFLGINFNGAAVIVDLLQRIEELEEEIERLKRGDK
ncbi:MAG: chaperone modulator CbpM [Syntrophomonadaceae bacterium]|jgi:MerR family transcriptional regulator/heat shock protein HspR|nr:hypothetical protein [Syntrophomonadaceae bacterium]